ncbi:MAG: wax ester/triacylglycerol synthase family O-acyltransferase [Halioglobus sp.]|nr:wax ester/triacylglycerol synthase family O-acyltransferase [Halioglobus sp.]
MRQLGGLDNLMIGGEMPNIPMHMSALMVYETGGKRGATALYQSLQDNFEHLVEHHFPILRCRLETVPLQLDKAYWVEDAHFNPDYHITRVALPRPQNWPALYAMFGQFHAQPLDRARPLWQVMVVEGLDRLEGIPRGSTALFLKIHHSVVDGKSALRLITGLHSPGPEPDSPSLITTLPEEQRGEENFQAPSWWEKYGRAWWHTLERPIDMAATLVKLVPQLLRGDDSPGGKKAVSVPRTRFNQSLAADRVVGHVRMELAQLRKLEKKYHCTINDIALCVVAGGVREFLYTQDELPTENLVTLMPIDVRRKDKDGELGNHVTVARVCLYTTIKDTGERLKAIAEDSSQGKKRSKKAGAHAMLRLVDDVHPAVILWLGQWLISSGHLDDLPAVVNTVVTNVPGMSSDAYLAGAKLIDYLGFGPLAPNVGLFHTVSSTPDHVNVSFLSTAELVGDGSVYHAALAQGWEDLALLV